MKLGATPRPVRATAREEPVIANVAVDCTGPVVVGVNVRFTIWEAPAARVNVPGEAEKIGLLVDAVTVDETPPLLLTVRLRMTEEPTETSPKSRVVGDTVTEAGLIPSALRPTVTLARKVPTVPPALVKTIFSAVDTGPSAGGRKVRLNSWDRPAFKLKVVGLRVKAALSTEAAPVKLKTVRLVMVVVRAGEVVPRVTRPKSRDLGSAVRLRLVPVPRTARVRVTVQGE